MSESNNIRSFSISAHVDHGKSTLTDAFVVRAGLMNEAEQGAKRFTDGRKDEIERGITIKSASISAVFQFEGSEYRINLIDTPGHVDFNAEVSASHRLSDGTILVVDAVESLATQTETVLRQALAEQVKPILFINKVDRLFFELGITPEEAYAKFEKTIEHVNNIISTYESKDSGLKLALCPTIGNVFFGSGLHGWGFSLRNFAQKLSKKYNMSEEVLMKKLWGEHYFDAKTGKIVTTPIKDGVKLERTFSKFVIGPIFRLIKAIMERQTDVYNPMLTSLGIKLTDEETKKIEKDIYKIVMKKFLPVAESLMYGVVHHLPSPKDAQKYRYRTLYNGPLDDECAIAMRDCDPNGPLMIYISKMIPIDGSRFVAFGRIFSGTASTGQKVRLLGPNYTFGKKEDSFENKPLQRIARMNGSKIESCEEISCGNTIAIMGIDQYLVKSCTVTTHPEAYPIKTIKFSVSPVVQVSVSPKNSGDLPKLVEGLKKLAKSDPCVQIIINDNEHVVAGVGELHIEICLNDLREFMKAEIKVSDPIVPFRESVSVTSSQICLSKSPNKHNRLYMTATPLDSDLTTKLVNGEITSKDDVNARSKILVNEFKWDVNDSKKIWAIGPEARETNMIVETAKGAQYLNEIKEHVIAGFNWVGNEGVLCGEPVMGVRFNLHDVTLHADAIHRGGGQLIPTARRVFYASMLTAGPTLMEPIFLVEIQVPDDKISAIYSCLNRKRGSVISEEKLIGELSVIKGYLPVAESFGFNGFIRENTAGQAFPTMSFSHYETVPGSPLDPNTLAGKYVREVRKRKQLPDKMPDLNDYLDKL